MTVLLILLLSSFASGNVFQLKDTSARFLLRIKPSEVFFESESLRKTFIIRPCSLSLAKSLNAELLALLPDQKEEKGLRLEVDQRAFFVAPKSDLGKKILAMEPRILRFALEESKACK